MVGSPCRRPYAGGSASPWGAELQVEAADGAIILRPAGVAGTTAASSAEEALLPTALRVEAAPPESPIAPPSSPKAKPGRPRKAPPVSSDLAREPKPKARGRRATAPAPAVEPPTEGTT